MECQNYLAAEVAEVLGVLADLHLLDDLTETRTIASTVLSDNADLLSALRLQEDERQKCGVVGGLRRRKICYAVFASRSVISPSRHSVSVRRQKRKEQAWCSTSKKTTGAPPPSWSQLITTDSLGSFFNIHSFHLYLCNVNRLDIYCVGKEEAQSRYL